MNLYLRNMLREEDGTAGGEGGDDTTQEKSDKTFTQAELDKIVEQRLQRERKKFTKESEKKDEKPEEKPADKDPKEDKRISELEMKVKCYDHDIAKEHSKKAFALANAYVDDETDLDDALEKVLEEFPQFKKGYKEENNQSWGERQKPPKGGSDDGVMAAFKAKNPNIKL